MNFSKTYNAIKGVQEFCKHAYWLVNRDKFDFERFGMKQNPAEAG